MNPADCSTMDNGCHRHVYLPPLLELFYNAHDADYESDNLADMGGAEG